MKPRSEAQHAGKAKYAATSRCRSAPMGYVDAGRPDQIMNSSSLQRMMKYAIMEAIRNPISAAMNKIYLDKKTVSTQLVINRNRSSGS